MTFELIFSERSRWKHTQIVEELLNDTGKKCRSRGATLP